MQILNAAITNYLKRRIKNIQEFIHEPMKTQKEQWWHLVNTAQFTKYGIEHGFKDIKTIVETPLVWNDVGLSDHIITVRKTAADLWPTTWEINSELERESYFVGLKIINNNIAQLGWVELAFGTSTGKVSIEDKGIL